MSRRFGLVALLVMMAVLVVVLPVAAQEGIDIGAYTSVTQDIVGAVADSIPGIITSLGVVVAGLIAVAVGVRLVRRFAK